MLQFLDEHWYEVIRYGALVILVATILVIIGVIARACRGEYRPEGFPLTRRKRIRGKR